VGVGGVLFSCGTLHAQTAAAGPASLTVLVRVCSERDRAALERVLGQTSDLAVTVLAREDGPLEPGYERQLERARQLASEQRVSAVVWFAQRSSTQAAASESWLVYVATPADGRVLAHRLEPGASDDARDPAVREESTSALLEQSALIVRFALQGLIETGDLATALPPPTAEAKAPARNRPERAEKTAVPAAEPEERDAASDASGQGAPAGDRVHAWFALGYELAADGFAPAGVHALRARAGAELDGWEAGLVASAGLPVERETAPAGMRLQRVRLGALLGARLPVAARWSLALGAQVGTLLQRRTTIGAVAGATARASRWNADLVLGPEVSLHMRSQPWGLVLGAALDVLPSPTHFALRAGDEQLDALQPARVQPRVFIAAELAP
jgi:hypothetical protein